VTPATVPALFVTFNDGAAGVVTASTATSLSVSFTTDPTTAGSLTAVATINDESSGTAVQVATVIPVVTPNTASIPASPTTLEIDGFGFDSTAANNAVVFNDGAVGTIIAATSTTLDVSFTTEPTTSGSLTAVVTTDSESSGSPVQVATISVASPTITPNTTSIPANASSLVISGSNFDTTAANNTVTFNDGAVGTVTAATTTSLSVSFTTDPTTSGSLTAVVTTDSLSSGTPVQVATVTPVVTPNTASIPANATGIVINGFGFEASEPEDVAPGTVTPATVPALFVTFNDGAVGVVTASTATSLSISFTTDPTTAGSLTAVATINDQSSGTPVQVATVIPVVTPNTTSIPANSTTLVINGFGFDSTAGNNTLTFNDGAVGTVTAATATSLSVSFTTVPTGSGSLTAVVTTDTESSGTAVQVATVAAPASGSLSGSSSPAVTTGYNLTTLGTSDWAQFGQGGNASAFDHKDTGNSQISNVTRVGAGSYGGYTYADYQTSWSDGTPLATDGAEHGYVWANGVIGAGYSFTAPADTTTRTLYVYVGGFSSGSTLVASLSDAPASSDYTISFSGSGHYSDIVAITYTSASAAQTLTVSYTKTSNINGASGSADLIGAWLVGPANQTKPVIATNPQSRSVTAGTDVMFSASATGTPPLSVQWEESTNGGATFQLIPSASFTTIPGATSTTLDIGVTTTAENGYEYEPVFSNAFGSTTTSPATLTVTSPTQTGGSLSGASSTAATSYNLSQQGASDWAHWGRGGVYGNFDHKASGGSQISNVTKLGSGSYGGYTEGSRDTIWTDGSPTTRDTGDTGYIWANNALGAGFSFTVPASTTTHTVYIDLGGFSSGGTLTAHLSDSSAPDYVLNVSGSSNYTDLVAITYKAASANQKLTLSYVKTQTIGSASGSVDLISAWLK
jgi:hypothetical protein